MKKYNLRVPVAAALLAALSIVLGKFLAVSFDTIRISFENLPLILSSVLLGPVWGALTALVADLLGCVLRGYAIIPLITLAQTLMGLLPGIICRVVLRRTNMTAVVISVIASHVVCSMLIKTAALSVTYGSPFGVLLLTRIGLYTAIGAFEAYIAAMLAQNRVLRREFALIDAPRRAKKAKSASEDNIGK